MHRSRSRVRIAAFLVAFGLVGAAVPSGGGAAAQANPVTLQVTTVEETNKYLDTFIAEFEASNPNIDVELARYPAAQYPATVRTGITAGNVPDVVFANSGHADELSALTLGDAGLLENLAGESWAKKIPELFKPAVRNGKKVYSHPLTMLGLTTFYDKEVFSANGIEVPTTFPDLLAVCETLSAKGVIPMSLGGALPVTNYFVLQALAASLVPTDFMDKRLDDKTTFAKSKEWKRAMDRLAELNKEGCLGPNPVAVSPIAANTAFASGKAGMLTFPASSNVQSFKATNPTIDLGVFPLPGGSKASQTRLAVGTGFVPLIPKAADQKAAAKKFVAFLVKNQRRLAIAGDRMPLEGELPAQFAELTPFIKEGRTDLFYFQEFPNPEVLTTLNAGLQDLLLGRTDAATILASMDAAWARA